MLNKSGRSTTPSSRKASGQSTDLLSDALTKRVIGWVRQWGVPALLQQMSVRRNNLLRTTVARWREKSKCLELGPQFFRLTKRQDEILCHELAHAAALQIYGQRVSPHGPEWRALVEVVGYSPRSVMKGSKSEPATSREIETYWFEHRCSVCHSVRYAKKPVTHWRCAECSRYGLQGLLKITKLERRP